MSARAFITGLSGAAITSDERAFLRDSAPWGLILFKRNIDEPGQVRRLVAEFRDAVAADAPVLVDQEGGRVQRLGPPHWPVYPPGAVFGQFRIVGGEHFKRRNSLLMSRVQKRAVLVMYCACGFVAAERSLSDG
jgi:hypothetical protein